MTTGSIKERFRVQTSDVVRFGDAFDDHFIHGHYLSAWIVDYVHLEESLAVGSVAQEEIAHAAAFAQMSGLDAAARDWLVFDRPAEAWRPSQVLAQRLHKWPAAVLRGLLLAHAAVVRSAWLSTDDDPAVAQAAAVLGAEQVLHVVHWEKWLDLLGSDSRASHELSGLAGTLLPMAGDVFAADGDPKDAQLQMHQQWTEGVAPVLSSVGIDASLLGEAPVPRRSAAEVPEFVTMLDFLRSERVGPEDGVRGLYR